jgi:hypothetical protein
MLLRSFIGRILRDESTLSLQDLVTAMNTWAAQGHTYLGRKLWTRPFGAHYVALLLGEPWASGLGNTELREQARFLRENGPLTQDRAATDRGRRRRPRTPATAAPTRGREWHRDGADGSLREACAAPRLRPAPAAPGGVQATMVADIAQAANVPVATLLKAETSCARRRPTR